MCTLPEYNARWCAGTFRLRHIELNIIHLKTSTVRNNLTIYIFLDVLWGGSVGGAFRLLFVIILIPLIRTAAAATRANLWNSFSAQLSNSFHMCMNLFIFTICSRNTVPMAIRCIYGVHTRGAGGAHTPSPSYTQFIMHIVLASIMVVYC